MTEQQEKISTTELKKLISEAIKTQLEELSEQHKKDFLKISCSSGEIEIQSYYYNAQELSSLGVTILKNINSNKINSPKYCT